MTDPTDRGPAWPAQHPAQYTVEGEIHMMGEFAAGASRARGWRGQLARVVVVLLVAMLIGTGVLAVVSSL